MAKNKTVAEATKKTPEVTNPVVNEESIEETIKSENKMDEKVLNDALDTIQKEKDERKATILKQCICKADYINKRELISLKRRRAEANATKEALTASKEALDKLTGGNITSAEYDKMLAEIDKKKEKAFSEAANKSEELVRELKDNYPSYYSYEWEYSYRRSTARY